MENSDLRFDFVKMNCCGNDFVIIDCLDQSLFTENAVAEPGRSSLLYKSSTLKSRTHNTSDSISLHTEEVRKICNRKTGIGCDQLIILLPNPSDIRQRHMHVWNNDGSKARFCGNGARCAAAYISKKIKSIGKSSSTDTPPSFQKNSLKKEQTIKEEANIVSIVSGTIQVECKILDPWIVDVRQPFPMVRHAITKEGIIKPCESIELENGALAIPVFALNQHAVVMNKRPENRPISEQRLEEIAQSLQCHQMFPEGTNVSITSFDSKNCLAMTEVWERGVGATSACGSAACAVGASIFDIYKISSQVNIVMPGGQIQVNRSTHNGAIFIHHSSRAEFVFQGEFVLNYYKYDSK